MTKRERPIRPTTANKNAPAKKRSAPVSTSRFYWMPLLCMILAFIVYSPVFKAGFVNWDDDDYVVKNHAITSLANIREIITHPVQGNYHPLTMLSLAINYAISGKEAASYHIVNLLLHLLNILLVFLFIKKLTGNKHWLAFVVAMLFAVHPLHVESVAWIAERKDVLYAFFFLAGLLQYLRFSETGKPVHYLAVLGLFVLSLLSKPAAIVFPLILLAIDYYNGRLKTAKAYYEKIPFLLLSFAMGLLTMHAQKLQGAIGEADLYPLHFRFFFGFYGMMMYVVKTVWPFNLCTFYPFPAVNLPLPPAYILSPLFGLATVFAFMVTFRKHKLLAFAILFYLINLLLVLQFIPVGSAIIADRYAYLPLVGLFLVPAYFFQRWIDNSKGKPPALGLLFMSVIFIILSVLTFRQAATWKDGAALWDQAISIAPSSRAYSNRGLLYKWENNPDQALEMFNKAISINKAEKDALVNRGNIYFNRQQFEKAIADYNICLSIDSTMVKAIENRGSAYGALGKYELALIDLDKAIQLNPETENGYANRAVTYQMLNRNQEAIADFYRQMEVNHLESADILNSIAVLYTRLKDYDKAIDVLSKAIAKESKGVYYLNLAVVYREQGRNADARSAANKAISLGAKVDSNFMNSIQ